MSGTFNNLNQLTSLTGGSGKLQVSGAVRKIAKVTVLSGTNSYPATTLWGTNFSASIAATLRTNTFSVVAQDENTNLVTNRFQINVSSLEGSRSFSYDANGNLLNDGQRTYTWDAANRLASVTLGTNTYSFGYDFAGRRISEKLNGTLIKQSVWDVAGSSPIPLEERNASNTVTKRFYAQGQQQDGTNYFYLRDHLGSVREMVNGSGTIVSEATYDPYGVATVSGTVIPTFQYAGYYAHQGSGLNLTWYRAYDPVIGRWLSRDPLPDAERLQGPNLYAYVGNNPVNLIDPLGLWTVGGRINVSGPGFDVSFGVTIDGHGNVDLTTSRGPGATGGLSATLGVTTTDAKCVDTLHGWGNSAGVSGGEGLVIENNVVWGNGYVGGDFGLGLGAGLPVSPQGARTQTHSFNR